jgi:hypothetical protein
MAESKFGKRFRSKIEDQGFSCYRVESHSTEPGMPDIHFIEQEHALTGWLELKQEKEFPSHIDYRPRQAAWLELYWKRGGLCATLLHVSSTDTLIVVGGNYSFAAEKRLAWLPVRTFRLREAGVWAEVRSALQGLRGWS